MTAPLPYAAYVAALASLPEVGPARLSSLLARGHPREVLDRLASGRVAADAELAAACGRGDPTALLRAWRAAASGIDVDALWAAHVDGGVTVLVPSDAGWPARFDDDPDPPAVLFTRGDPEALVGRPVAAVVGTRGCSRYGWDVAHRLGRELAAAGVVVVSGLARGIDGAAHRGALDAGAAPPAGVVGTGLDVVYPRQARALWEEVASHGVLVSEAPLGTRPARWRFPARNRLIAALADVVVVVESAASGGALHTVDEALARDRPVLAVPGPVTSPSSVGTNRLLRDVAQPACDTDDVLTALGVAPGATGRATAAPPPPPLDGDAAAVLDAVGWTSATLDAAAGRSGRTLGTTATALARLEAMGLVAPDGPGRWVRVSTGGGVAG